MPEFTCNGVVRHAFGFYNPNHAAALMCAVMPFSWGRRGAWRWLGCAATAALAVMLALTYSRTGFVVMVCEMAAWWLAWKQGRAEARSSRCGSPLGPIRLQWAFGIFAAIFVAALAAVFLASRMNLDGAAMNRPKIWLAGLRLAAANPWGVGFGNSGEIVSAFMLPRGIAVRTLVNSHLTLLAELGWLAGAAWLAFICAALVCGKSMLRTRIAFAGLAASAFASSVFDWHVLFDFADMGGLGGLNFALGWLTLLLFIAMGAVMIVDGMRRCGNTPYQRTRRSVSLLRVVAFSVSAVCLVALVVVHRRVDAPRVAGGYVAVGRGEARVFRDAEWTLSSVASRFPDGARFCIRPGVPSSMCRGRGRPRTQGWRAEGGEVWLFGAVAESAWRFPTARVTLVAPPEL